MNGKSLRWLKRAHMALFFVWVGLMVPSLTIWKESVPWLVFISVYALVGWHFLGWQEAKLAEGEKE